MAYIDEINLQGKKVLVRLDFNVPIKDGVIQDDNRLKASLPTLQYILKQGGTIIACSHLGKPKGKFKEDLSLKPVAERLGELLEKDVIMAPDCIGSEVEAKTKDLQPGQVVLLENLRFHPGETENDPEFSKKLGQLADMFVNDAFGTVHRAHASVAGVPQYVQTASAGFLIKKEIQYLGNVLENPEHPFVLIAGGAKVSDKIGVFNNFLDKVDRIIVGGAMANTFRKAQGYSVSQSKVEDELLQTAKNIMDKAREKKVSFYLPVDYVLGKQPDSQMPTGVYPYQDLPQLEMILDIGPATHTLFSEALKESSTVVWNGPMGAFENPTFSQGSVGIAHTVAGLEATTIVGGGDTGSLLQKCQLENKITFISTGGGSFLEFLEGRQLPGLKALGI